MYVSSCDAGAESAFRCVHLSQGSNLQQRIVEEYPLAGVGRVDELVSPAGHLLDEALCLRLTVMGAPAYRQDRYSYDVPGDGVEHLR